MKRLATNPRFLLADNSYNFMNWRERTRHNYQEFVNVYSSDFKKDAKYVFSYLPRRDSGVSLKGQISSLPEQPCWLYA